MINTKRPNRSPLLLMLFSFLLLHFQIMNAAPASIPGNEQSCKARLDQAEEHYYNGELDKSIVLVRQCLENTSLNNDESIRAHKILARCYLATQEIVSAKQNVRLLLQINPEYQPTIEEESPGFVKLVNEVRVEQAHMEAAQEKAGITPWIWIGAGSAAAAAVIVLVTTGSGGESNNNSNQPLPAPPTLP